MEQIENHMVLDEIKYFPKKVYGICEQCGRNIYYGDDIIIDGNVAIHEDCEEEYIDEHIKANFIHTEAERDEEDEN